MISRVTIDGFRGIDDLTIDGLGRINVFVGANGGGKTSILEAMDMVAQPFALQGLDKINRWRELPPLSAEAWHGLLTIFSDLDPHRLVRFDLKTQQGEACVTLRAVFGEVAMSEAPSDTQTTTTTPPPESASFEEKVRGIEGVYRSSQAKQVKSMLELIPGGYRHKMESKGGTEPGTPIPGSFFIHARHATSLAETANALTDLYARKAEGAFVDAVRIVDPRIKRLVPGVEGKQPTVLADLGLQKLIPITVLGDGFCRVSLIVTGMVSAHPGKLLIVDEIDSGLHHTVMRGLWESLVKLSYEYDFQVFCSTHNEEMLRRTIPAFSQKPEALRVYRISRDRDNVVSQQTYDYEMLQDAEELGMDIR